MNNNGSDGKAAWIEVRDSSGKLIFKYDPVHNNVEIKPRDSDVYILVRLDELRLKHGYTPEDLSIVFVAEYVAVDTQQAQKSKLPFSNGKK